MYYIPRLVSSPVPPKASGLLNLPRHMVSDPEKKDKKEWFYDNTLLQIHYTQSYSLFILLIHHVLQDSFFF